MKLTFLIISIISLFLIGCSSTYKTTDFKSKKDFYNNFNDFMKNKDGKVTLKNDSTLSFEEGAEVSDDSLLLFNTVTESKTETLPLNKLEKINYYGIDFENPSAYLKLKNGEKLNAKNIKILKDSMKFTDILQQNNHISLPLNEVKEATYKRKWDGIIRGLLAGVVAGGILGAYVFDVKSGGNPPLQKDTFQSALGGALIGVIVGPIVGYLIGWNFNYQFNP